MCSIIYKQKLVLVDLVGNFKINVSETLTVFKMENRKIERALVTQKLISLWGKSAFGVMVKDMATGKRSEFDFRGAKLDTVSSTACHHCTAGIFFQSCVAQTLNRGDIRPRCTLRRNATSQDLVWFCFASSLLHHQHFNRLL